MIPFKSILAATDFTASSDAALRFAAHWVRGARARMRRAVGRLGMDSAQLTLSVGRGPADIASLQRAQALGTDLIVAGKQGRSTLGGFLLGSVSSRVLSGSDCDVLIVPRQRDGWMSQPVSTHVREMEGEAQPGAARAVEPSPVHWTQRTPRFLPRRTS